MQLAEQKEVSSYIWIYLTPPPPAKLESVAPKNLSMDEIIDADSSSYYEAKVAVLPPSLLQLLNVTLS